MNLYLPSALTQHPKPQPKARMLNFTMRDSPKISPTSTAADPRRLRVPSARTTRRKAFALTEASASSRMGLMSYGLTWNTIVHTRRRDATHLPRKATAATGIDATSSTRVLVSRILEKNGAAYTRIIEIPFSRSSMERDRSS